MRGEIKIKFSEKMIIPQDYLLFDEVFFTITVIPDLSNPESSEGKNKNIKSWSLTDFKEN